MGVKAEEDEKGEEIFQGYRRDIPVFAIRADEQRKKLLHD